ncbi:hypothetical protein COL401_14140 [Helicobacter pylori]
MLKTYHIALACVILAVVVLLFGGESLSLEEWQEVCLNVKNHFLHNEELSSLSVIILEIRLPRVILALLVGASLSGSGVVMQTIFRNPLVDPFLLGISSGAMLGVAMAIAVVESNIAILAFFGAILASLAVLAMNSFGQFRPFVGAFRGGVERVFKRTCRSDQILCDPPKSASDCRVAFRELVFEQL